MVNANNIYDKVQKAKMDGLDIKYLNPNFNLENKNPHEFLLL